METEVVEVSQTISPQIVAAVVGGIAGMVSGALSSVISPWVHYYIEKRKSSFNQKIQILSSIRDLVDSDKSSDEIQKSSLWGVIESNLSNDELRYFAPNIFIEPPRNGLTSDDVRKQAISRMVFRLEKEWLN